MPKGNSIIPNAHFHKKNLGKYGPYPPKARNNQASRKAVRRAARATKAAKVAPRPLKALRPSVQCATVKYNMRARLGRGFTRMELKVRFCWTTVSSPPLPPSALGVHMRTQWDP